MLARVIGLQADCRGDICLNGWSPGLVLSRVQVNNGASANSAKLAIAAALSMSILTLWILTNGMLEDGRPQWKELIFIN